MIVTFNPESGGKSFKFDSAQSALHFVEVQNDANALNGANYRWVPVRPTLDVLAMMAFDESLTVLNAQVEADRPKSVVEIYPEGGVF